MIPSHSLQTEKQPTQYFRKRREKNNPGGAFLIMSFPGVKINCIENVLIEIERRGRFVIIVVGGSRVLRLLQRDGLGVGGR